MFRLWFALAVVVLLAWAATRPAVRSLFVSPKTDTPAGPVEADYSSNGPYSTTTQAVVDPDGTTHYQLFRPADYSTLGFLSPIVTWGVGTGGTPTQYSDLLDHLASYGFTVIAPDQHNTGSGDEIAAAARYLITQAQTAGSVFDGRLDVHRVAAAGHSQGAGGAVRAAVDNPALIDTVVTFSLPSKTWVAANADCPTKSDCMFDLTQLRQPAFLIGTHGVFDSVIASASTERDFYDQVPGRAVLGLIESSGGRVADHNSVQGDAGSRGFLGYVTAWLCAELRGDPVAATAFDGTRPELVGNANWPGSATR
jgi:pimeloyl-ACP methyl ester carboxylesterase